MSVKTITATQDLSERKNLNCNTAHTNMVTEYYFKLYTVLYAFMYYTFNWSDSQSAH